MNYIPQKGDRFSRSCEEMEFSSFTGSPCRNVWWLPGWNCSGEQLLLDLSAAKYMFIRATPLLEFSIQFIRFTGPKNLYFFSCSAGNTHVQYSLTKCRIHFIGRAPLHSTPLHSGPSRSQPPVVALAAVQPRTDGNNRRTHAKTPPPSAPLHHHIIQSRPDPPHGRA
ncbi:hypothetical protein BC567DRAFT_20533 [Phyllosticta citribraziliensis]